MEREESASEQQPAEGPVPVAGDGAEPEAAARPVPEGSEPARAAPAPPPRTVVPRWIQAVVLPLALIGLYELARAAHTVFLVVVIASILALVLNPLVKLYQRAIPRGFAIAGAYVTVIVLILAIGVGLFSPVASEINHLANNVPALTKQANHELNSIQNWLTHHGVKVHIQKQGQTALQAIQKKVLKSSNSIVSFSKGVLSTLVTIGVDAIITIVLSIYMLIYARPIGEMVRRLMPPGDGTPQDDYPLLVQRAVSWYVRGQILFSLIMGLTWALIMWIFGLTGLFHDGSRFALFFGAFYGLMEFIPYVGPVVGPIPSIVVALVTHPISALWVLIGSIALQEVEGHIVAPQIFRLSLRINPILVILALLIGNAVWGIPGALVALPAATVIRATVLYLRDHLALEPWARENDAGTPPAP